MKILIADDHAIVREGVKQIVKTLPEVKQIDEVADGKEALSKLTKTHYDLISSAAALSKHNPNHTFPANVTMETPIPQYGPIWGGYPINAVTGLPRRYP